MKLIIDGVPVSQARMRHSTFKGYTTTYDPKAKEKKEIRKKIKLIVDDRENKNLMKEFNFPRISAVFMMPIPKNIPKKLINLYESGLLKHVKKPDIDNLLKLYLDCLDGIVFEKDQKVSIGSAVKVYGKEPKTIIWIEESTHILTHQDIDPLFLDVLTLDRPLTDAKDSLYGSYIPFYLNDL